MPQDQPGAPGADQPPDPPPPPQPDAAPAADTPDAGTTTTNTTGDVVAATAFLNQGANVFSTINNGIHLHLDAATTADTIDGLSSALAASGELDAHGIAFLEKVKAIFKHPSFPGASLGGPQEYQPKAGDSPLPETEEELSRWYYKELQESERAFVQAVAVVHGAPQHEVIDISKELFAAVQHESPPPLLTPAELYKHTHTKAQLLSEVTRVFWEDADASGNSRFHLRILRFLSTTEVTAWTRGHEAGGGLFDLIKEWPITLPGESAWRTARALGIMWKEEKQRLREQADAWANGSKHQEWSSAASLLNGAYDLERFLADEQAAASKDAPTQEGAEATDSKNSPILQWIRAWVTEANGADKIGPGCAAAYAYGLIGRQYPQVALEGLDQLLGFPRHRAEDEILLSLTIFAAGLEGYLTMAASGHIFQVLTYLANVAECLVHRPEGSVETRKREREKLGRDVRLFGIFTAFFLLASVSHTGTQKKQRASYSRKQTFPERAPFPDDQGRDVLLMALLAQGSRPFLWRKSVTFLLCAALLDGNPAAVTQVLKRWGHIVIRQKGEEQQALYNAYVAFMVELGKLAQVWTDDLARDRLRPRAGLQAYLYRIRLWQYSKKRGEPPPLADLAREVLAQLGVPPGGSTASDRLLEQQR